MNIFKRLFGRTKKILSYPNHIDTGRVRSWKSKHKINIHEGSWNGKIRSNKDN